MKCIVKERRIRGQRVTDSDRRIAYIEGQPPPKQELFIRYLNSETGDEYRCLAGGFAWPGLKPGFAVVLAVQGTEKGNVYKALDEIEEKNVDALLERGYDLFRKYGKNCNAIRWQWYGDPESGFNRFFLKFNAALRRSKQGGFFYLTYPPHFKEPDRFRIYCRIIYSILHKDRKRLFLGACKKLQSHLGQLSDKEINAGTPEDYPAVGALGYVLSALHQYEPWKRPLEAFDPHRESFETVALREQRETLRDLDLGLSQLFDVEEMDYYDDSTLIPTVR